MAGTARAKDINEQLVSFVENARNNPYVQKVLEDDDLRDNALSALKSARGVYDRASAKGSPAAIATDKKLRKELKKTADALKETRESLVEAPAKKRRARGLRRLALLAVIGGAAAIALNEGLRSALLDKLFGAEEEFTYESTTASSINGSAKPAAAASNN